MVILKDVADGYLLQCGCGTRLSCRHGHGVVECPKCSTMQDPRRIERRVSQMPAAVHSACHHSA